MERQLEPEVMDTADDAMAYDAMDHSEVNRQFVDDLLLDPPDLGRSLDVGTGTGLIAIELCKKAAAANVTAVDLSANMLDLARANAEAAGVMQQVRFDLVDAKGLPFEDGQFTFVMSNSIVHHIPEPISVIREAARVTSAGGRLFFRDLFRPTSLSQVDRLVELYAGDEEPSAKQLFHDSLRAALTVEEVREMIESLGFDPASVQATSDRHWTWSALKSKS